MTGTTENISGDIVTVNITKETADTIAENLQATVEAARAAIAAFAAWIAHQEAGQ